MSLQFTARINTLEKRITELESEVLIEKSRRLDVEQRLAVLEAARDTTTKQGKPDGRLRKTA